MTLFARVKFHFECRDGGLYWIKPRGPVAVGDRFGCPHPSGYRRGIFMGRSRSEHRLVWLLTHGSEPAGEIDHINGDRSDNRPENLRAATRAENCQNRGVRCDSISGVTGVHQRKESGKWRACVTRNGKTVRLGGFDTKEQAIAAREALKRDLHEFHPDIVSRPGSAGDA